MPPLKSPSLLSNVQARCIERDQLFPPFRSTMSEAYIEVTGRILNDWRPLNGHGEKGSSQTAATCGEECSWCQRRGINSGWKGHGLLLGRLEHADAGHEGPVTSQKHVPPRTETAEWSLQGRMVRIEGSTEW